MTFPLSRVPSEEETPYWNMLPCVWWLLTSPSPWQPVKRGGFRQLWISSNRSSSSKAMHQLWQNWIRWQLSLMPFLLWLLSTFPAHLSETITCHFLHDKQWSHRTSISCCSYALTKVEGLQMKIASTKSTTCPRLQSFTGWGCWHSLRHYNSVLWGHKLKHRQAVR